MGGVPLPDGSELPDGGVIYDEDGKMYMVWVPDRRSEGQIVVGPYDWGTPEHDKVFEDEKAFQEWYQNNGFRRKP